MFKELLKLISKLINLFFPRKCMACGVASEFRLCPKCFPPKAEISEFGKGLFYLYSYSGSVKKLIYILKFNKDKTMAEFLVRDIDKMFFNKYDIVIPIPCHFLRIFSRGFFHLKALFKGMPGYNDKLVIRTKNTGALFKKGRKERECEMKDVFKVKDCEKITGKKILILDDIYTTGTTYQELKKELSKCSPQLVEGFFLCRA